MITLSNITDGEQLHQRCVLVIGYDNSITTSSAADAVLVATCDAIGQEMFPTQAWPIVQGHFKALLMLVPGDNHIKFSLPGENTSSLSIKLTYIPLLQVPPLHLAILVAKDSPLLIDCPQDKGKGLTTAHADLNAVVAKFRLTAYMWQALTAEDMRQKGLGRRSFRLDHALEHDTVSSKFLAARRNFSSSAMHATAKINLVYTDKTVAELRNADYAQQNPSGRDQDKLHDIFTTALKIHGGVFASSNRPVVAGLILDSHFSVEDDLVVAHAALGAHNAKGLSLGIMGSHLTYSWPRFLEEIPACLLDTTRPDDTVCNDNKECNTMWEACSVGQGAFLHEVGHAFSADHSSGIMARGYSQDWPKCFLAQTSFSMTCKTEGVKPVSPHTPNQCRWDIRDALRFTNLPHFGLPSDRRLDSPSHDHEIIVDILCDPDSDTLIATCQSGICGVWLNGHEEGIAAVNKPIQTLRLTLPELESRFKRSNSLELEVLGMNGKSVKRNVWLLFSQQERFRVPGTGLILQKRAVGERRDEDKNIVTWAAMLKKRSANGLIRANKIDLRVGCLLDGAIIYYKDGSAVPCGHYRGKTEDNYDMGGHQSRSMALPAGVEIKRVLVSHDHNLSQASCLCGLRMELSTGKAMGALNRGGRSVTILEPPEGHAIIGFYGQTASMCTMFGIITAPRDAEIPESLYDMAEFQHSGAKRTRKISRGREDDGSDDDTVTEDADTDYDSPLE